MGEPRKADVNVLLRLIVYRKLLPLKRYAIAAVAVVATALVRAAFPVLGLPFLFFIPPLMAVAFALGRGPGFLATLLSTLIASYLFVDPPFSLALSSRDWLATGLFAAIGTGIAAICDALAATLVQRETDLSSLATSRAALEDSEAFVRSVLASSTDCIKVLDLDGRVTFMSEGGQQVMEVSDFNQIAGCPWPEFWKGDGNVDAVAAIAGARNGIPSSFTGHAETMAGNGRWWHVAVSPILGSDGRPERILSVSRDITSLRESEQERDHFVRLVENSSDFIAMARLDGSVFFLNQAGCRLVGLTHADLSRVQLADFLPPEQAGAVAAEILPAVERNGSWSGERLFRHFRTGESIPVNYSAFPVQDAEGKLVGFGTVTRDIREQKRAEERQALLNGEIVHRLKNTLAMVQSIATMTLRSTLSAAELERFTARLRALARSHDLLLKGAWEAGDLRELVGGVLENAGALDRCRVEGRPVRIGPRAATSTAMVLHELATNAMKYGALSVPAGSVSITWTLEDSPGGQELFLHWSERGGPPTVESTRKGFGSRLVSLGLTGTGGAKLRYEQAGLTVSFRAKVKALEQA